MNTEKQNEVVDAQKQQGADQRQVDNFAADVLEMSHKGIIKIPGKDPGSNKEYPLPPEKLAEFRDVVRDLAKTALKKFDTDREAGLSAAEWKTFIESFRADTEKWLQIIEQEKIVDLGGALQNVETLKEGEKYDEAIALLEKHIASFGDTTAKVNSEFGVKLDGAKAELAELYGLSKEQAANKKEMEEKQARLLRELQRNEGLRQICTEVASEISQNPKAFDDIKNFKEWFKPDVGLTPDFFKLPPDLQNGFLAEVGAKIKSLQVDRAYETASVPEKIFFGAQVAMDKGDLLTATRLLLKYREEAGRQQITGDLTGRNLLSQSVPNPRQDRADESNPLAQERAHLLQQTDEMLRTIALRKCDEVAQDLQQLDEDRKARKFEGDRNERWLGEDLLAKVRKSIEDKKSLTFSEALVESQALGGIRGKEKYYFYNLFLTAGSRNKDELYENTLKTVDELNSYTGSSVVARDKLDRALSKKLSAVEITEARKKELHALSTEEAVKHKEEAVTSLTASRDGLAKEMNELDEQVKKEKDEGKRTVLWQKYNQMNTELRTVTVNGRADGEIHPALISRTVEKACDETYRLMLRKDRYLKLNASGTDILDGMQRKLVEKSIRMDDMYDETFTFSADTWRDIYDTSVEVAIDIAVMTATSGVGSMLEAGLTRALAMQLAEGGLKKYGLQAVIGLSKVAGEGFAMTAIPRSMTALALLAQGRDGAEAYDGFAKEWGQNTLMFGSIHMGNALFKGTVGRLGVTIGEEVLVKEGVTELSRTSVKAADLTLKQSPAMWLAYHGGQLGAEVEILHRVDQMGAALGLTPESHGDELTAKLHHMVNVLKFRAGGKIWNATSLGGDMAKLQQEMALNNKMVTHEAVQKRLKTPLPNKSLDASLGMARDLVRTVLENPTRVDLGKKLPGELDMSKRTESGEKPMRDLSKPEEYAQARAELKEKLDSGVITKEQHAQQEQLLRRRSYIDLMTHVIAEAQEFAKQNPDATAEQLADHLINNPNLPKKPSKTQQEMIRTAAKQYEADRAVIRERVATLKTPEGKAQLLKDLGITNVHPDDVMFDTSHPASIGVIFLTQEAYLAYALRGLEPGTPDYDRVKTSGGIAMTATDFPDSRLNGKIFCVKLLSKRTQSTIDHEVQHLEFRQYFDRALYRKEATSESYAEMKKNFLNEILAYLKGGDWGSTVSGHMGLFYENIHSPEFVARDPNGELSRIAATVFGEFDRLRDQGFKPREVYKRISSSESVLDIVDGMRSLGSHELGLELKLSQRLQEAETLGGDHLKYVLDHNGLYGDVDPFTGIPFTTAQKIDMVERVLVDYDNYRNKTMQLMGELRARKDVRPEDIDQAFGMSFDTGELQTWSKRYDRVSAIYRLFDSVDRIRRENPEMADRVINPSYDDMTGEVITPAMRREVADDYVRTLRGLENMRSLNQERGRALEGFVNDNLSTLTPKELFDHVLREVQAERIARDAEKLAALNPEKLAQIRERYDLEQIIKDPHSADLDKMADAEGDLYYEVSTAKRGGNP